MDLSMIFYAHVQDTNELSSLTQIFFPQVSYFDSLIDSFHKYLSTQVSYFDSLIDSFHKYLSSGYQVLLFSKCGDRVNSFFPKGSYVECLMRT